MAFRRAAKISFASGCGKGSSVPTALSRAESLLGELLGPEENNSNGVGAGMREGSGMTSLDCPTLDCPTHGGAPRATPFWFAGLGEKVWEGGPEDTLKPSTTTFPLSPSCLALALALADARKEG